MTAKLTEYPTYVLYGQGVTYGTPNFYYGAYMSQTGDTAFGVSPSLETDIPALSINRDPRY